MRENAMGRISVSMMAVAAVVMAAASATPSLAAKKKKAATPAAEAAALIVGNPATDRKAVDTYTNFTVIDTNHPVSATGFASTFQYYAESKNPFEFVLVDKTNTVEWVSP